MADVIRGEYAAALLPGSNVWADACLLCGAIVLRRDLHDAWHSAREDRDR